MQDSCSSGDSRSKVWRPQKGRDPWSCSSGDLRSKPLGKGRRKMTQVGGHEKKRTVRSKFARKSTTKVQELDWRIAQKGPFFQKTRRKHRKGCKQRENSRPQDGTYKNCVIGVSTGQIDGSNAGSARDQWDRVAWQQTNRTHIAKIAGNQTRNKQGFKEMKFFSQKIHSISKKKGKHNLRAG